MHMSMWHVHLVGEIQGELPDEIYFYWMLKWCHMVREFELNLQMVSKECTNSLHMKNLIKKEEFLIKSFITGDLKLCLPLYW